MAPVKKNQPNTMKVTSGKAGDILAAVPTFAVAIDENQDEEKDPKNEDSSIMMPFRELSDHRISRCMRSTYGKQVVPLPLVGHFLNFVGNNLLNYIYQVFSTNEKQNRIFYPMHKVEQIQLMSNGECLVKVSQTKFKILQPPLSSEGVDIEALKELTKDLSFKKRFG
jgi:hypothetical protein